jgi:hypothetical protein
MPAMTAVPGGIHGRMVQRIVAVGGGRTYEHGAVHIMRDRFLRALMKRGTITAEHVQRAVRGYNAAPSNYLWIAGVEQSVFAMADCVFLAEFGRFPTEKDFQLNGRYHKICRGLEHNRHYYDEQLKKLRWDRDGNPYVRCATNPAALEEVRQVEVRRGNAWLFVPALVVGLVGGPLLAATIARNVPRDPVSAVCVFGVLWVLLFAGFLAKTLPGRVQRRKTVVRCGRCRRELSPNRQLNGCSVCGLLFEG